MATFAQITKKPRPPGRTVVLDTWVFADEWDGKPREPVCVGLRLMSEGDKSKARAEAERLADELHPKRGANWVDAFNDCLIRQVAALGICDPNEVTKPSDILPLAEEQVRFALTSRGARFIFDEHDRYEVEVSPLYEPLTDEELAECARLLEACGPMLDQPKRKLLRGVLEALREVSSD